MRAAFQRATRLPEVVQRVRELRALTTVFDVEPLVANWGSDQKELDRGIVTVLDELASVPTLQVVCFATNSARRPSTIPSSSGPRVVYLASALKPLRTAAYRSFPRPAAFIGDQIATDGILARRLGYAFVLYEAKVGSIPQGPRLLGDLGRLIGPLFFRNAD